MKKVFNIKGMHCNSCSQKIETALQSRVNSVSANFSKETAEVEFNPEKISEDEIKKIIQDQGYEIKEHETKEPESEDHIPKTKHQTPKRENSNLIGWIVVTSSLALFIFVLYTLFGANINLPEVDFSSIDSNASLFLLFFTGLLTGFHCIAMCGGFLVSYTAKNAVDGHKSFNQHLIYGASKTISYTIIGALFGLIGSIFFFTPKLRGGIAIFAGIFMLLYAMSMFGFKFFRRFQFNPKFLTKIASKKYKGSYFGPMMTGLLNGLFIACGPLQALYIYAAGTGSPVQGGLSLMAFGLGTLPVMLGFGGIANAISHKATRKILKFSAIIVLILAIIMLNRGLSLTGSGYDITSIVTKIKGVDSTASIVLDSDGYQIIEMDVLSSGWSPDSFVLQKDVPVKWIITGKEITGCNNAIQVPDLDLNFQIKPGEQTIEFTPTKEGVISWSCWMGMIRGTFVVTHDGTASQSELKDASQQAVASGGSCGGGAGGGGCGCGG